LATKGLVPFIGARDERLQQLLQHLLQMDVQYVPMSTFMRNGPAGAFDAPKTFHLGMVGQFRAERGSEYIPEILAGIARRQPHVRFLLQVENEAERTDISKLFADAGAAGCVGIVAGSQTIEQFYRNVASCRALVLPYVPDRYRMRSSGVLSVATGLGVPVIVPGHTWLSDRIEEGSASGFVYDDLTATFLEGAVGDDTTYGCGAGRTLAPEAFDARST
jgi:hypothetical protein